MVFERLLVVMALDRHLSERLLVLTGTVVSKEQNPGPFLWKNGTMTMWYANCNINANFPPIFSIENAERMENCPWKTMLFY